MAMRLWSFRFAVLGSAVLAAAAFTGTASAAPTQSAATSGRSGVLSVGCGGGAYPTIGSAVNAAAPGDTIDVCPGTYRELVTVPAGKPLTLRGTGSPVIDATGLGDPATGQYSAVLVQASGTTVEGLAVTGATGEGILVQGSAAAPVAHVTVRGNRLAGNDRGNPAGTPITTSPYRECDEIPGPLPGDCGEAIHLQSVSDSAVAGDDVTGNAGGILLTDESGPTHGNLIAGNTTSDNSFDCGVVLGGHNPNAAPGGVPDPAAGGVYGNTITRNRSTGNGLHGDGSGVLLGTAFPGGAVYGNRVTGNYLSGNGLSGVTVHSHVPGEDLNGNVIAGNLIGANNLHGDLDGAPADPSPTGVLVRSAGPLSITITGNVISKDAYGIWLSPNVTAAGTARNVFASVGTPVYVAP
jgi:nitrous oxidase accessory protein NosD